MRSTYLKQLNSLEKELIVMGSLCEAIITKCVASIGVKDFDLAEVRTLEDEINQKERELENLCIRILLLQQPVAGDLKYISASLKMVTDLERIGDNAADIAETAMYINKRDDEGLHLIEKMGDGVIFMVRSALDAFVRRDKALAKEMIEYDNIIDDFFLKIKKKVISSIDKEEVDGESITDLMMCAKYLERIGDHAVNVAKWAIYAG
ncbi:phosphate signaling complex protein PhoU [Bullifex porci]|uniref:Phosphate-specific transport system accessory protein PhoU homolog n=3 Tax=Bullifex porci TaxID=2606638 RepID=A0A7X2PD10_9SPIO|nr:phosphate signaling complex protein PhoU [Bullifex porci]MDD7254538.1 phosphate signaling complex protein PhoU [Bullifex porci]MDY2741145.1 phosphate signaling complex protein PhoU [Bullifex porci]MSU06627.1 phosphate signaling complex protein PhoU [Bullifex porci]